MRQSRPKGSHTKTPGRHRGIQLLYAPRRNIFEAVKAACPFRAVSYDEGMYYTDGTPARQPYELAPNFDYGRPQTRDPRAANSLTGAVRKCTFCLHRLNNGFLPACVTTCLCRAVYFGDLNDPDSLVSRLLAENEWFRLHKHAKPRLYYKGKFVNQAAFESCAACHEGGEDK